MKKVLFIDTAHPLLSDSLEKAGFVCDFFHDYKREDFLKIIHEYQGIIIRSKIQIDRQAIDLGKQLKFIGRIGSGMESIDVEYAEEKGIKCLNSPEGNRDALAEHTTGMLLTLTNNLIKADREIRRGIWKREENRGSEILGKTLAIIGYGNMGSALAKRLSGFGCKILAYDKYKADFGNSYVEECGMERVFREADILSLHIPLTNETRQMVNYDYISKFDKSIILINTARGPIVDTKGLVKALNDGKVKAAALDVIEYEESSFELLKTKQLPKPMKFLTESDRVILSPHIAGWTHESKIKLAQVLAEKIINSM